jgi:hypothetical protein
MNIQAIFSNGQVDVYKGSRPVRAAWQVVCPDGQIVSGHSLDRAKAQKTAEGNAALMSGRSSLWGRPSGSFHAAYIGAREKAAREAGYRNYKEYYAAIAAERAAFVASCKIEVIDLKGA